MRARPVMFSDSTGLRLCGIADEPFCPSEKNSSASSTSVRCKWRTSIASRSIDQAILRAGELRVGLRELEPKCDRLGMDAVRAADGRCHLVLEGAAFERVEQ